jgi:double-stranded uracil-DNA glycosylase
MNPAPATRSSPASGGLEQVAGRDTIVLVLGSFPSQKSLLHSEYYGNPQNQFWKIMEALFAIDAGLPYAMRIERVKENHLALWDVVQSCSRPGSADSSITDAVFNDIRGFAASHPALRLVALNGSAAARFYSRIAADIGVPSVVLPSTSPANARMTLKEKTKQWTMIQNPDRYIDRWESQRAPDCSTLPGAEVPGSSDPR